MRFLLSAITAIAICLTVPTQSLSQRTHFYLTGGSHSDLDGHYAGITGGGNVDLIHSWISAGAESDVFFSGVYAAGRAGPTAQFNIVRHRRLRPFAIGGFKWGEGSGPMLGGGIEFRPKGRIGFRATVGDTFKRTNQLLCGPPYPPCSALPNGGNPYFRHGLSIQAGIAFR